MQHKGERKDPVPRAVNNFRMTQQQQEEEVQVVEESERVGGTSEPYDSKLRPAFCPI